ncbi:hypothetical protein BC826DRAFT_1185038 [Russula brevipes]|nr:hypothetical protein BC826DRAFT_1185038 [Russula brevipes]
MSYPPPNQYQPDDGRSAQPYDPRRNSPRSHSLQPVQNSGVTRTNRSLSGTRPTAQGQAQAFESWQSWEPASAQVGPDYVPSTPVGQYSPQPVDYPPPIGPPPPPLRNDGSLVNGTHDSPPQQHPLPSNIPQSHIQYPQSSQYAQTPSRQQLLSFRHPSQSTSVIPRDNATLSFQRKNSVAKSRLSYPGSFRATSAGHVRQPDPICRLPDCHSPVTIDERTRELSEYCSLEHMRDDVRRGVPLCPACEKCPRRVTGLYCGSSCERWAAQQQRLKESYEQAAAKW